MAWCLTKDQENKFKQALIEKKIDPFKLADMSSDQRRTLFEKYVDPQNAIKINSLFESKLLLKNQISGFKSWVNRTVGITSQTKRDLYSRIDRLQELGVLNPSEINNFKKDLARTRLGLEISFEEAQTINTMAKQIKESKEKLVDFYSKIDVNDKKAWKDSSIRLDYGIKQKILENYVDDIRLEEKRKRVTFKEDPVNFFLNPVRNSPEFLNGLAKSLMSTLDDSFFGRQGVKNLYGTVEQKKIWGRNFLKSFADIESEIRGKKINGLTAMDLVKADIYSRPNALNGKYNAGDYRLGVLNEEVFPESIQEILSAVGGKIPVLSPVMSVIGKPFAASETAFSAGALRMRADLADMYIRIMEENKLNTLDPKQARPVGHIVGSLTGRGSLGQATPIAGKLNAVFWSVRYLKSNIDTLTAHQFDPIATPFSKKIARQNLGRIVGHLVGIMLFAKLLNPDAVDEDPRSTNFGKIKVFGKWVDITGGMGSLTTLAARLVPTKRNGEWGSWKKSSTGSWANLTANEYGKEDAFDLIVNGVFANKMAPLAAIFRDYLRGEMFGGEPFNIQKSIVNSATPLSIQQYDDLKDEKFSTILGLMIFETSGFGVSTYKYKSNWSTSTSKEMTSFKEQVGEEKFKQANTAYNTAYNIWYDEVQQTDKFKSMSDEERKSLITSARSAIKDKIMKEYGYRKQPTRKTAADRRAQREKEKLLPK